jgi:hypothetical protein
LGGGAARQLRKLMGCDGFKRTCRLAAFGADMNGQQHTIGTFNPSSPGVKAANRHVVAFAKGAAKRGSRGLSCGLYKTSRPQVGSPPASVRRGPGTIWPVP